MKLMTIILLLGSLQAFILAFILLTQKKNVGANKTLTVLLFLIGITCSLYAFNSLEFYLEFPHVIRLSWGLPLLFGPLLYLYTMAMIGSGSRLKRKDAVHGFPFLINTLCLLPFYLRTGEEKIQSLDYFTASITAGTDNYAAYYYVLQFVIVAIGIHYALQSLKVLKGYQKQLLQEFSEIEHKKIQWLNQLIWLFLALFISLIIFNIRAAMDRYANFDYQMFFYIGAAVLVYVMSFKTFSQPQLHAFEEIGKGNNSLSERATNERLPLGVKGRELIALMQRDKPFLNSELSATKLSVTLQISRHQLSEIINKEVGKNFYDFINEYRINEFKLRLADIKNNRLTILALAYDSGFSSKSSFNTAFKKHTGVTPSQFKKDQGL
jgi:AraC-like DNA-binding protein